MKNNLELAIMTGNYSKVNLFIEDFRENISEMKDIKMTGSLEELPISLSKSNYKSFKKKIFYISVENQILLQIISDYILFEKDYISVYKIIIKKDSLIFDLIKRESIVKYLDTYKRYSIKKEEYIQNYICFRNVKLKSIETIFKKYPCKIIKYSEKEEDITYTLYCFYDKNNIQKEFLKPLEKQDIYIEITRGNKEIFCCFRNIDKAYPLKIKGEEIIKDKEIHNYLIAKFFTYFTSEDWEYYDAFKKLYTEYIYRIKEKEIKEKKREQEKLKSKGRITNMFNYEESKLIISLKTHKIDNINMIYNTITTFFALTKNRKISKRFKIFYNDSEVSIFYNTDINIIEFTMKKIKDKETQIIELLGDIKDFVSETSSKEYNLRTKPSKIINENENENKNNTIEVYIKYNCEPTIFDASKLTKANFKVESITGNIKKLVKTVEDKDLFEYKIFYEPKFNYPKNDKITFNGKYNLNKVLAIENPGEFLYNNIKKIVNNTFNETIKIFLVI